jgi:serine/threonine protein kinase/tetratricopeptide (TPR) repeat protein
MGVKVPSVEAVFGEALEISSASERASFLDRACAGDLELRRQVQSLLDAHFRAGQFLESPASSPTFSVHPAPLAEGPGTIIGPYKLLEQIGEGGMGVVFMAEQTRPVRRKVALKIVKPGMDTRQVVARFEAERQALALMDHPNISRVLDAGGTESGRPYFVMDLVRGIPITDYCDRNRLGIGQRLELFVVVCQAVQHAHQKGVIHRDLKPSNVLVTIIDGAAFPKVIDFGVAKAMGHQLTERTLYTGFAQLLGTPLYMSPEQAELSGVDADTRSDIYSLGVLLYELMTGTTPFEAEAFRKAGFDEIRRMIREQDPPRPSTRLSTLGATLATVSMNRSTEPLKLTRTVRGELDWIVMKCLEKDRSRRYETANGLAVDVRRYLEDEPVAACPPSAWYRFGKLARRNRTALITAGLVALALLIGTGVSAYLAIRATRAEAAARDEADKAKAINEFLEKDLLVQASPMNNAVQEGLTLREVLDRASEQVGTRFSTKPLVEAAIRCTIGETYAALGAQEKGRQHLARAIEIYRREKGPEAVETANAMVGLGEALWRMGKAPDAEPILREATDCLVRALGEEHPDALSAMLRLGHTCRDVRKLEEEEKWLTKSVGIAKGFRDKHGTQILGAAMADLAECYMLQGKLSQAEPLAVEVLGLSRRELGEDDPITTWSRSVIERIYKAQGKLLLAEQVARERLASRRRVVGEAHGETLEVMSDLAQLCVEQGKVREAEAAWREVLTAYERVAAKAPDRPLPQNNLAWFLVTCPSSRLRDPARAVELARKVVDRAPENQAIINTLGVALYRAGDWKAALEVLEESMRLSKGGNSFDWFFMAMAYWQLGKPDQAHTWNDRAVEWMDKYQPQNGELKQFRAEAAALFSLVDLPEEVLAPP